MLICFSHSLSTASEGSDAMDEQVSFWLNRFIDAPDELFETGQELIRQGQQNGNCNEQIIGYTLTLEAFNTSRDSIHFTQIDTINCPLIGQRACRAKAFRHYGDGEYTESRRWYEKAHTYATNKKDLASLRQSIGITYYMQYDLENALLWLTKSAEFGIEFLTSISLSNMSNVCYVQGKYHDCLKWSELAEERLIQEFQAGTVAKELPLRMDMILINEVFAYIAIGDAENAETAFRRMQLEEAFPMLGAEYFHGALQLAWLINDPYPINKHEDFFSRELMSDSIAAVERFGPALCLIDPWKSQWNRQSKPHPSSKRQTPWAALRKMPQHQLPVLEAVSTTVEAEPAYFQKALPWTAISTLLIWGVLIWRWRTNQRLKAPPNRTLHENIRLLRKAILNLETINTDDAMNSLYALAETTRMNHNEPIPSNLSDREVDVLLDAVKGERPKSTADRLGLSVKTVYMLRTELRNKIGLEPGANLEDWAERIKSSHDAHG